MDLTLPLELLSAAITLLVFVYLFIGDNPLFRVISYSFVGVAAGYVLVLVIFQVLVPRLINPLLRGNFGMEFWFALIALVLSAMLLFKLSPSLSFVGNVPMAILVGVGAAVAIGGAVFGTLFGQIGGTAATFPSLGESMPGGAGDMLARLAEGLFVLAGTICTLAYFQFSVIRKPNQPLQRSRWLETLGKVGQVFIGITLGATFAGVFAASIAAFIERVGFLIDFLSPFL